MHVGHLNYESVGGLVCQSWEDPEWEEDKMMSCSWIWRGYHQREIILASRFSCNVQSTSAFVRAVIKDWLVALWFCCHRTPHMSDRHRDQCRGPWESCSAICQRIAVVSRFSPYLSLRTTFVLLIVKWVACSCPGLSLNVIGTLHCKYITRSPRALLSVSTLSSHFCLSLSA